MKIFIQRSSNCRLFLLFFLAVLSYHSITLYAQNDDDPNRPVEIKEWLVTGAIEQTLPIFNTVKNLEGEKFELKDLLEFENLKIDEFEPEETDLLAWSPEKKLKWTKAELDPNDNITWQTLDSESPQIVYLAGYLNTDRWIKTTLTFHSSHFLKIYLDGKKITEKTDSNETKEGVPKPGKTSKEVNLETGTHLLVVKALRDPDNDAPWNIKATLQLNKNFEERNIKQTVKPEYRVSLKHVLDVSRITNVSISPNADLAAIALRRQATDEKVETWLELYDLKDDSLYRTYRGGTKVSAIQWAPAGRKFSYINTEDEKQSLWVIDLDGNSAKALLENVENLSSHAWSPDGTFIIYAVTEKPDKTKSNGLKLLKGMEDRRPTYRDRSFLYKLNVNEGTRQRLTSGLYSTTLHSISNKGDRLIFSISKPDYSQRPYSKNDLFILDLSTMDITKLWSSKWHSNVQWSPDDNKLLITAGPEFFDAIGKNVSEGTIPNDYDTQAFIYDIQTKNMDPITKDFDPTINQAIWQKENNYIYFKTADKAAVNIHVYDPKTKKFKKIDPGVESVLKLDIAKNKAVAVYSGSSATIPAKAYVMNLKKTKSRLLLDPAEDDFDNVVSGDVKRWNFINQRGTEIQGDIYYPPGFDPQKQYPCIVYYYSGTYPTPRMFGGSYPKSLYAAQGYVVYVLQPSGAVSFGQEFSALHVNDWGIIVADEIIDGVKQFVSAHRFVDPERIGCIGASYGGFMTMLLQTRTDIFAAAVAHAGISSISSYWGEGYWGYTYSAVAAADSFPWNRKDIFIKQSPLFNADKVNTPLLLLHGSVDTNVPPGESIQMYTALKLLGKEVEFIKVEGENHGVYDYKKRVLWMKSTLAWFDRYLKDQPQWWDDMYEDK